ncbi:biotin-dependent carboxyltransferase family protein [Aquipuribacter sp. MA13-6]|uniref:5-oxoprolinase subunit C family protein n=1 Tax=Aquipuribacter sp. MA13-6 TaxID=3440839 RepID=UPI003EECCA5F
MTSQRPRAAGTGPRLRVLASGPATTVQDEGRTGYAAWGVTRSGACDRAAYRLGNRLVGNQPGAASLEVLLGGLRLTSDRPVTLAVTGAPCGGTPLGAPFVLRPGRTLHLTPPPVGLRSYVAVRGGVDVEPVLGSRSTDTLSGLGPAPLRAGDEVPVGPAGPPMPGVDLAAVPHPPADLVRVRVVPGPRLDRFTAHAWPALLDVGRVVGPASPPMPGIDLAAVPPPPADLVCVRVVPGPRLDRCTAHAWPALLDVARVVGPESDHVGVRLQGGPLVRDEVTGSAELPSEGVLRGAVQVPPSGTPVVFLSDHPVTGGYPVVAYVRDDEPRSDVDRLAQARPGQVVRFTR